MSAEPDAVLSVLTADCAPVALVAPGVVGAVHAGWRGVLAGVLEAAVAEVRRRSDGPITGRARPVHPSRVLRVLRRRPRADRRPARARGGGRDGRRRWPSTCPGRSRWPWPEAGVTDITDVGVCTACSADHFSHRRDGRLHGVTGLQTMLVAAR